MSQAIHIFRKDFRHHWPEILLSLALPLAFTWNQPRVWTGQVFEIRFFSGVMNFLPALMAVSWAFLIIRLVQSESLVGDRQFWITRPYVWHSLLAAKFLSILLFLHLPLFLSQITLLKLARFPLASSIPGLLFIHLLFVLVLVLPSLTVGAVTSGIGQASLLLLCVFLLLLGLVWLMAVMPDMDFATDSTDSIQESLFLAGCIAAVLIQYIYRRARLARLIVAGTLLLIAAVIVFAPYQKIIAGEFPLPSKASPLPGVFALDPALSFWHVEGYQPNSYGDDVELEVPFQVKDLREKAVVQIRAVKLDLELPDGKRWTSHWHSLYDTVTFGRTHDWPGISMKKALFNRIKDAPVRAHITLGFNVYELDSVTQVSMPRDRLSLPGGARCLNQLSESWLQCFAALKEPHPLFVAAELPSTACPVNKEATSEPWASSPATFASLAGSETPDFDFTPVRQFNVSLSRFYRFEDHSIRLPICAGTRLLVSAPKFLYSVRGEFDLGDINLLNYVPTYPRVIAPPRPASAKGVPSDSLSQNLMPQFPHSESRSREF